MDLRNYKALPDRLKALEKELGTSLSAIGSSSLDASVAAARHCENMIGFTQVPLGVAGPIKISAKGRSSSGRKDYYIPLATTEGALVASINRGCKAITESGGAEVLTEKVGMTRSPVFRVKNIRHGQKFMQEINEQFKEFKRIAESTSSHINLLSIKSWMIGRNIFVRFTYDTQDAMGMNMVTIATSAIVSHIESDVDEEVECIALSGNMCVDKKSNYLNFIEGRGFRAWAEAFIPKKIIKSILKTTAEKISDVWNRKVIHGSIMSGSIGANAHAANILAAFFLATGQDIAHIGEASSVVTSIESQREDLYISVYLPDLPVGTIGGGTSLATQKEALEILGIVGGNNGKNAQKLAGIIGATVLAGELSLLASLAEGTLSQSHQRLAREEQFEF